MNIQLKYLLKNLISKGFNFKKVAKKLEQSQSFTESEIEELQNKKLSKLIAHCYKNVPYYKELFDELGLKPSDIKNREDLKKLPFLDKHIVREKFDKLVAKNRPKFLSYETKTSGTTGTPGRILWDNQSLCHEYATISRFYNDNGDTNLKRVTLRGNLIKPVSDKEPPYWIYNKFNNELVLSSYHLNADTAQMYLKKIVEFEPQVLYAYPSTAFLLAKYSKEHNVRLNFSVVFTSSETLTEIVREFVETSFNCKILDWYGQVERVAAIGQCDCGSYHIQEDYSIVELIDSGFGLEVVGTHLYNYAMPLLRYKTGDTVEMSGQKCDCGSNFRSLSKIYGKNSDYYKIITKDGPKITSLAYIPMGVENIIESQFVQEKPGQLIINITTNGHFCLKDREKLIKNTLERTSPDMVVLINEVKEIPRGANGKFQPVINKISEL